MFINQGFKKNEVIIASNPSIQEVLPTLFLYLERKKKF